MCVCVAEVLPKIQICCSHSGLHNTLKANYCLIFPQSQVIFLTCKAIADLKMAAGISISHWNEEKAKEKQERGGGHCYFTRVHHPWCGERTAGEMLSCPEQTWLPGTSLCHSDF